AGNELTIEADKIAYGEEPTAVVPLDAIADARLVLTDDLVRDALKKDKKLRQDRKRRRKEGDEAEPGDDTEEQRRRPDTGPRRHLRRRRWQSVRTGWSFCRLQTLSRAKNRSTRAS